MGHLNGKPESDLQFCHMCKLPMTGQSARRSRRVEECVCQAAGMNERWHNFGTKEIVFILKDSHQQLSNDKKKKGCLKIKNVRA